MLRLLFVSGIFAVGLVVAARSRFGALVLYVWFALFRPQEWMWIDISVLRPSLMLGLILVVPCLLTGVVPLVGHVLSVGALVFVACAFVAQIGAIDQAAGWYWLDFLAKLVLVALFAVRLTSTRDRVIALVGVIAFSFGFHPIKAGVASLLGGGVRYFGGPGGAFIDNNAYALGTAMTLPLLIATAQNAPWRPVRWIAGLSVPLAAMTVVSTFSRGGLLALSTIALTLILLQRRRLLWLGAAAVILPVLIDVMPLPSGYSERISTLSTYEERSDDSALGRLHYWQVALRIAADRPLGIGLWNFEANFDQYDFLEGRYGTRRAVHNSHLQALTETGWAGGVTWILLFVTAFHLTFRARAAAADLGENGRFVFTTSNALISSMAGFLVGGTFVSMALNDLTWLTFALVASLDRLVVGLKDTAAEGAGAAAEALDVSPPLEAACAESLACR